MAVVIVKNKASNILFTYSSPPSIDIPDDNDSRGDGGHACFICGRSMKKGESFVCVSRYWKTGKLDDSNVNVLDCVASIQACKSCTILSASSKQKWVDKPKLVDIEINGFYMYAKLIVEEIIHKLADTCINISSIINELEDVTVLLLNLDREILAGGIYRPSAVVLLSDDQCCSCHRKIDFNKPHLSIEIEVDTPGVDIINPSCIMPLGNYCSACARKLFHLYDNEFDVYGIWR